MSGLFDAVRIASNSDSESLQNILEEELNKDSLNNQNIERSRACSEVRGFLNAMEDNAVRISIDVLRFYDSLSYDEQMNYVLTARRV